MLLTDGSNGVIAGREKLSLLLDLHAGTRMDTD
jgi:hypothetical protein